MLGLLWIVAAVLVFVWRYLQRLPWPRHVPPQARRSSFKSREGSGPPSDWLRALASQRRQERLANPTVPELRFNDILNELGFAEGVDYEREAVVFYLGSFALMDFLFPRLGIAFEIDGFSHHATGRPEHDCARDLYFLSCCIRTHRFTNRTVMGRPWVCRAVARHCHINFDGLIRSAARKDRVAHATWESHVSRCQTLKALERISR